jgi:hypothetical protein
MKILGTDILRDVMMGSLMVSNNTRACDENKILEDGHSQELH